MQRDANGRVRGLAYHDGYLDGISLKDREVQLAIRSIDNERSVVSLQGVERLKVDNFREGNILADLWWLTAEEALQTPNVSRQIADAFGAVAPELCVFVLESSYGANLVAVCERAEVSEILG